MKYALTSTDAPVQIALDPFVKLPTANHKLGNGRVEAGLLVPVAVPIGKGPFTLSLGPELDLLADLQRARPTCGDATGCEPGDSGERQAHPVGGAVGDVGLGPGGYRPAGVADGSIAYLVNDDLQLDGGINCGLNRQTTEFELYTGVSLRF